MGFQAVIELCFVIKDHHALKTKFNPALICAFIGELHGSSIGEILDVIHFREFEMLST